MFIEAAWEDFVRLANDPNTLPSKRIELHNYNKMLADLLVRILGKPRAESKIAELLDKLEGESEQEGQSDKVLTGKRVDNVVGSDTEVQSDTTSGDSV